MSSSKINRQKTTFAFSQNVTTVIFWDQEVLFVNPLEDEKVNNEWYIQALNNLMKAFRSKWLMLGADDIIFHHDNVSDARHAQKANKLSGSAGLL